MKMSASASTDSEVRPTDQQTLLKSKTNMALLRNGTHHVVYKPRPQTTVTTKDENIDSIHSNKLMT